VYFYGSQFAASAVALQLDPRLGHAKLVGGELGRIHAIHEIFFCRDVFPLFDGLRNGGLAGVAILRNEVASNAGEVEIGNFTLSSLAMLDQFAGTGKMIGRVVTRLLARGYGALDRFLEAPPLAAAQERLEIPRALQYSAPCWFNCRSFSKVRRSGLGGISLPMVCAPVFLTALLCVAFLFARRAPRYSILTSAFACNTMDRGRRHVMEFEKSKSFKLPRIGANAEALRAIETVLAKSGPCVYRYYQDAFDSLDALLAGRDLPLERIDLDSPAATVCIERSGVTVHHRPEAHDIVRELQAAILRQEITPLARAADLYRLMLMVVFLGAYLRDAYSLMMVTGVVGALLEHTANTLIVKKPLVKLPFGMQIDQRIWWVGGMGTLVLVMLAREYFRLGR
jgi:hypothetical protein